MTKHLKRRSNYRNVRNMMTLLTGEKERSTRILKCALHSHGWAYFDDTNVKPLTWSIVEAGVEERARLRSTV